MTTETIVWHAVTDCLPEEYENVMMFSEKWGIPFEGFLHEMKWHTYDGLRPGRVTHWADMPKGPRPVVDLTAHVIGVPV